MGYSEDSSMVRVDFFKESGKWGYTEAVRWTGEWEIKKQGLHDAWCKSLIDHLRKPDGTVRMLDMIAVCLKPYHEGAFPLMTRVKDALAHASLGGLNMYPELRRDVGDQDAAAESDAYERGRWEAIKEAASHLQEVFQGHAYARAILANEAQRKREREARRGGQ